MRKRIILVVLLSVSVLNAAIITVDNNVQSAGNYSTLQAAHDGASAGDIIYVFPSQMLYPAITVTKPLSFYGVGFDLLETIGEPYTATASISGEMQFETSATGSHLEGFDGQFTVRIRCMNVTVKRNELSSITIEADACTIIQNQINSSDIAINMTNQKNHIILNNLILAHSGIQDGKNLLIKGNILQSGSNAFHTVTESMITNNIIVSGNIWFCYNNTILYNMCNSNQLPTGNGNLINIDMNTVFVNWSEGDYHLLPNSPARGAGENGVDMGIYGGDTPYIDGGFPGLPSILQIQAPTAGSQQSGLDISFKAKSNKE